MNKEKKSEEIWKRLDTIGFVGIEFKPKESPCKNCKLFKLYGEDCYYFWYGKFSCSMREEDANEKNQLEKKTN